LQKALRIYQRAYDEYIYPVEQSGEYLSSSSVLYTFWATILREMNQLDKAEHLFLKSQELARFRDLADTALDNEVGLAWIAAYRGEDSRIKALEKRLPDLPSKKAEMVQRHTASMKLFLGDRQPERVDSAFHWANEQVVYLKPLEQLESVYLIWVQALLLRKRWGKPIPDLRDVLAHLEAQQHLAEVGHFLRSQIQSLLIKARVYQELGEMEQAIQAMGHALKLAQPEGYVRIFINERTPIAPLLQAAIEQEIPQGTHGSYCSRSKPKSQPRIPVSPSLSHSPRANWMCLNWSPRGFPIEKSPTNLFWPRGPSRNTSAVSFRN
jgi:LuxR family maltose regulon positive regulatory protein